MIRRAPIGRHRGCGYPDDRRASGFLRGRLSLKELEIASAACGGRLREW